MTHINTIEETTTRSFRHRLDAFILAIAGRFGDKSREVERFLKFAIVGAIGAIVDFATVFVLQATVLPPVDPLHVALATSIAFCAAILSNFTWNRLWTYPDSRSRSLRRQLALFTFISLVGWLGRTAWIAAAHLPLGKFLMPILLPEIHWFRPGYVPSPTAEAKLGTFAAMVIGIIIVMFWNFFANRMWTYNDVE
jgi:putative flippase GtrA